MKEPISNKDADQVSPQKFHAVLQLEGKTATGIQVPAEVVSALGSSQRPPVRVTIGSHTYRTTVAAYSGVFMIPVSAEHRTSAGVSAGDEVEVIIELDSEPRVVSLPADFAEALDRDAEAKKFFESLSYSNKRRITLSIEGAKAAETRRRRIEKSIAALREGKI
jgi:hypothetical protein